MVYLTLGGVPIDFPFRPYDVQEAYMERVIECLQKGVNGLLESPTGTGKTLCLLCSCLGWLATRKALVQSGAISSESELDNQVKMMLSGASGGVVGAADGWGDPTRTVPLIIYASRTHSQLSQVVAELKRSSYRYMKVSILGSRDQLCIHPEVSKEQNNAAKLHMCHARTTTRTCYYYTNLDAKKEEPDFKESVLDIEDLVKLGKKHSACPYFMAREIRKRADIIFMPYNYLLDPKVRKIHNIELRGNVVIFDEAHNVEKMCEESSSIELRSLDIALCVDEVTQVMRRFRESEDASAAAPSDFSSSPKDFTLDDLCILKAMFLELEKAIDAIKISKPEGDTLPGEFMLELLSKADLNPTKKDVIVDLLDRVIQYLTVSSTSPYQRRGNGLQKFADLVKIVFSKTNFTAEHMERVKKSYKVHIKVEQPKSRAKADSWSAPSAKATAKAGRVLSYWCFSPGFGMRDLMEEGVRCVILTSGTLSPLSSFAAELQVPFPVTLENPHIIGGNQVLVGVVTHGPDGVELDSSYKNRENSQYVQSLGRTIQSVSRMAPDGLLVFFPSYPVMKSCQEAWQLTGLWDAINQLKPIFVEPTSKDGFLAAMSGYYGAVHERRGACFMAVCRGKVSEGLDFCDVNGRAVIITGLPYPPSRDPRVLEKQRYLEDARKDAKVKGLTGQQWYRLEATRAVNQAIGRVIRHRMDFGAILLCDQRFGSSDLKAQLSAWIRPRIRTFSTIGPLLKEMVGFYRNAEASFPYDRTDPGSGLKPGAEASATSAAPLKLSTVVSSEHALSYKPRTVVQRKITQEGSVPEHVDLSAYSSQESSRCGSQARDIFSGDFRETINFNELNAAAESDPLPRPVNDPPASKKRKITIISSAQRAQMDLAKIRPPACCADQEATACESDQQGKDRKATAKDYLNKVRDNLQGPRFTSFKTAIQCYKRDKDFHQLVPKLKDLLLKDGVDKQLFRGFRQFLDKDHHKAFDLECLQCGR